MYKSLKHHNAEYPLPGILYGKTRKLSFSTLNSQDIEKLTPDSEPTTQNTYMVSFVDRNSHEKRVKSRFENAENRTDARTDARTDGRTDNLKSSFRYQIFM